MNQKSDSKPDTKSEAPPEAKSRKESSAVTKTPILNPAWADEAVKARGLSGALAKAVAADLAREVTKHVAKAVDETKVDKIVGKSFNSHLGKTRGA